MTNKLKYFIGNWKMFGNIPDLKKIYQIHRFCSLKKFKMKWKLPFNLLSDSKKEVAVKYGANSPLWTKRITFVIDENGKIEKIYRKMNVNTHAEKILSEINQKK